jgi:hypothetical protein
MGLPWDCYGAAKGLPRGCQGTARGLPWDCQGAAILLPLMAWDAIGRGWTYPTLQYFPNRSPVLLILHVNGWRTSEEGKQVINYPWDILQEVNLGRK